MDPAGYRGDPVARRPGGDLYCLGSLAIRRGRTCGRGHPIQGIAPLPRCRHDATIGLLDPATDRQACPGGSPYRLRRNAMTATGQFLLCTGKPAMPTRVPVCFGTISAGPPERTAGCPFCRGEVTASSRSVTVIGRSGAGMKTHAQFPVMPRFQQWRHQPTQPRPVPESPHVVASIRRML